MSTPDPPSSPARATPPRTPEQSELERRAVKAELAVLEARALASRAAEDYSKVKETEVRASRASRARAKTALKVALCALVVVGVVARGRGREISRLRTSLARCEDALATSRSDARAMKAGVRQTARMSGKDAMPTPKTLKACASALADERASTLVALDASAACEKALKATRGDDATYLQDAGELRDMLETVKRALDGAKFRLFLFQVVFSLVVACALALASQPAVRESFRNLLNSSDRRQIEANARQSAPSRAPRVVVTPASPTRLSRVESKTRIE